MSSNLQDIAQQNELIDQLQREVERQRTKIEHLDQRTEEFAAQSECWFWETDKDYIFNYLSSNFEKISGLDRRSVLGTNRIESAQVSNAPDKEEHIDKLLKHEPFMNFRYGRKDATGQLRHLVVSGWAVFNDRSEFRGYRGTARDETDDVLRLAAERETLNARNLAVAGQRNRFQTLIDNLNQSILWFDHNGMLQLHNKRVASMHGCTERDVNKLQNLQDYARLLAQLGEFGAGDNEMLASRHVAFILGALRKQQNARIHLQAQDRYVQARFADLPDGGFVLSHVDISKDVTVERQLSETTTQATQSATLLEQQRNDLHTVLENLSQSIMWYDKNGNLKLRNKQVGVLHNMTDEQLKKVTCFADHIEILAERGDMGKGSLAEILKQSEGRVFGNSECTTSYRKHFPSTGVHLQVNIAETPDGGRILSEIDITKQIEAEEELAQALQFVEDANHALEEKVEERTAELRSLQSSLIKAERDATMSELIAKLSHELRNPLNALNTSLYVIRSKAGDDPSLTKAFDRSERTIKRCTQILSDLYDFAMTRELKLQPMNITQWLDENTKLVRIPDDVEFVYTNDLQGTILQIDKKPMTKAIWKVFRNALQALAASDMQEEAKQLRFHATQTGAEVVLEISDNGQGMQDEIAAKALEPLFSTRGFGVGLGLPIAQQVFKRHGGGLELSSTPGTGTTVRMWLPATNRQEQAA